MQYQQYVHKEIRKGRSASMPSVFLEKTRKGNLSSRTQTEATNIICAEGASNRAVTK
jgi:hypothetical protein